MSVMLKNIIIRSQQWLEHLLLEHLLPYFNRLAFEQAVEQYTST
ncbi:hypothetical protein [Aerosakkonema funiforme]